MNTPDTERVVKYVRAMLENELAEPRFIDTLTNYISQSFTSRDTYWKERVRKEVEGISRATGINAIPTTDDYANGWNDCRKKAFESRSQALDTLLDNLK